MVELFYSDFGQRLAQARRRSGRELTQHELAERIGLSRSSLANIERGRQRVHLHVLVRLAEALEMPPSELLPTSSRGGSSTERALKGVGVSDSVIQRAIESMEDVDDVDNESSRKSAGASERAAGP
ncbi:MAG: helix-turn-helix transcriptional regulator [Acidobacteriota bacterium]|nr:helix-turn-helix transcriptional regulator [Acidobacteriota bacterium]